ncbi:PQQ-binding-like beta-propeller repeat protein [Solwaraspora sp. WMMD1047]|uniref:outer membrane protein assembly factor BamB family protein n=1 Tax=Solwaraspora sp. WMMD1047 TaxID=3016102 RepID=UPI002415E4C4|nr:PQQ-binding-like beta-propeller repeat protein [Solwaraspora sp. WMMD1047]MDG4828102.1 PQQ-binding-like beta-propeller repeat protein [Solwaraspora sp. WMMD1047]
MTTAKVRWLAVAAVSTVLALVAVAVVGYRVLAPAEVLTPATTAYPAAPAAPAGVIGTLNAAPLLVEGRLRVYATTRRVWADQPVDAATRRTPYWAYRRWPAQLVGVAVTGTTVVSRWSDGELVGLDARTGRIAWRAAGPPTDQGYAGRRTGASTVYAPAGLHTARTDDGRAVLLLADDSVARGFDPATGRELWRYDGEPNCRADPLTTAAGQFVTVDRCASPQVVEFRAAASGEVTGRWRPADAAPELAVEPVGCRVARSDCHALRIAAAGTTGPAGTAGGAAPAGVRQGVVTGWLTADAAEPVRSPELDDPASTVVDGVAVVPENGAVVGRPAAGGDELWRRPGAARILAVQPGRVHLRPESRELVNLDPRTGAELSRYPLTQGRDSTTWAPGFAYASDGFLAVERLTQPVEPDAPNSRYYLAAQPVILAAT